MDASARAAAPRAEKLNRSDFTSADPEAAGSIEASVKTCHLGGSAAALDGCWGSYGTPPLGRRWSVVRLQIGYGLGRLGSASTQKSAPSGALGWCEEELKSSRAVMAPVASAVQHRPAHAGRPSRCSQEIGPVQRLWPVQHSLRGPASRRSRPWRPQRLGRTACPQISRLHPGLATERANGTGGSALGTKVGTALR